jgi:hypothetical protein
LLKFSAKHCKMMFSDVHSAVVVLAFVRDYFGCLKYDLPDVKCLKTEYLYHFFRTESPSVSLLRWLLYVFSCILSLELDYRMGLRWDGLPSLRWERNRSSVRSIGNERHRAGARPSLTCYRQGRESASVFIAWRTSLVRLYDSFYSKYSQKKMIRYTTVQLLPALDTDFPRHSRA